VFFFIKMGKISRGRRKYHAPGHENSNTRLSSKSAETSNDEGCSTARDNFDLPSYNPLPVNFTLPSDLFAGIDISGDDLKQQLDVRSVADDTRSIVSKKSFKSERPYKKKEKRQLRREVFMMSKNTFYTL
jgi:hypothetical protein